MIIQRNVIWRIVLLILSLFFIAGCVTNVLRVNDIPSLQAGSPLRSVNSKTFAFKEFKDIRNVDDPSLLMRWSVTRSDRYEEPPATLVSILLKKELTRNGHKCVTYSSGVIADFIVEGSFYKNFLVMKQGVFTNLYTTMMGVKLMLSCIPSEKGVFVKSYEGDSTIPGTLGQLEVAKISARETLLSMIKEISSDLEMIEFLNKHP
jgi:uncharacterized lipoprotein YajG